MQKRLHDIIDRPFLATLDVVASPVHLKMKYQNGYGKLVIVKYDICVVWQIHEIILNNPLSAFVIPKERSKKARETPDVADLDVRKDKPSQGDESGPSPEIKMKMISLVPNKEFEAF